MAKPDFSLLWASNRPGGLLPISSADFQLGWQYRSGVPPLTINFDYYQNLNDQRTIWLSEQFPSNGTTSYIRSVMSSPDGPNFRLNTGTSNASNLLFGTLHPALLADSGVMAGSYGNGTSVPTVVVDSKGRIVNIGLSAIQFPALPTANEGQAGISFEATQTEVNSRGGAGKFMTPSKAGFGFSLTEGSIGGFQFPFWLGGWAIRWGEWTIGGNSTTPVYTFSTSIWQMFVCAGQAGGDYQPLRALRVGNSVHIQNSDNNSQLSRWFAVGRN